MTTAPATSTEARTIGQAVPRFVLAGALALVGLCWLAGHAPLEFKKPGLSLPFLGAALGWGLGQWARACGIGSRRLVFTFAAAALAAGGVFATVASHRVAVAPALAAWEEQAAAVNPLGEMLSARPQAADDLPPEDQQALQTMRREIENSNRLRDEKLAAERQKLGFIAYLEHRIPEAWGKWKAPLPTLFWLGEIATCGLLGAWIASKGIQYRAGPDNELPRRAAWR